METKLVTEEGKINKEESPGWEEFTLGELEKKLQEEKSVYYCVDPIRDRRTKRKLVDPRGILTATILRTLRQNWEISEDTVLRVTADYDFFEKFDEAKKSIGYYTSQLYRFLVRIFTADKQSYKAEVQGLATTAVEMLDTIFSYDQVDKTSLYPGELRTHTTYYDHLVNTAVYWLATFARINKQRGDEPGSIEVWKSRDKAELRQMGIPPGKESELTVFYDIYGRDHAASDVAEHKKSDLSLVLSGFFGALFHDVSLLDQTRIIPPSQSDIQDFLRIHTSKSNEIIKARLPILFDERPLMRSIIKNHHEHIDGSGYPDKKKDTHLFARILTVCDAFDELLTVMPRGKAIHYIAIAAGRRYDGEAVRALLACLQLYREQEILMLYEEKKKEPVMEVRVVKLVNRFRPRVIVEDALIPDYKDRVGTVIDLSEPNNRIYFI